mmetsp:Transcript_4708/g.9541  ORF Transcript_4708/g.9541 Transcript_4708/m.9541 type:complete len:207 (+) Transcript_4708:235-855(+)
MDQRLHRARLRPRHGIRRPDGLQVDPRRRCLPRRLRRGHERLERGMGFGGRPPTPPHRRPRGGPRGRLRRLARLRRPRHHRRRVARRRGRLLFAGLLRLHAHGRLRDERARDHEPVFRLHHRRCVGLPLQEARQGLGDSVFPCGERARRLGHRVEHHLRRNQEESLRRPYPQGRRMVGLLQPLVEPEDRGRRPPCRLPLQPRAPRD